MCPAPSDGPNSQRAAGRRSPNPANQALRHCFSNKPRGTKSSSSSATYKSCEHARSSPPGATRCIRRSRLNKFCGWRRGTACWGGERSRGVPGRYFSQLKPSEVVPAQILRGRGEDAPAAPSAGRIFTRLQSAPIQPDQMKKPVREEELSSFGAAPALWGGSFKTSRQLARRRTVGLR